MKEALLLDSGTDLTLHLVRLLAENGYVVRILAPESRAGVFVREPVYIHAFRDDPREALRELDFSRVEVAVFSSHDNALNLALAREAKAHAVPFVIIVTTDSSVAKAAEEEGIIAILLHQCIVSALTKILRLQFVHVVPVRNDVAVLDMLVTADSKILGRSLGDLEESMGVRALILRGDAVITSREAEAQEGDHLVILGPREVLERIVE